jgi:hypothetical protein
MKIHITILIILLSTYSLSAQNNYPDPDDILVGTRKQPAIFLVGSFHFAYYNLDAHKVDKDKQVDILSPGKQKELEELLQYIARFKPTKIAVEGKTNSGYIMKRYREYLKEPKTLRKNEIDQIGFRLMEKFKLDTIYGVDHETMLSDWYSTKDSNVIRPMLDSIFDGWDFQSTDPISMSYKKMFRRDDSLASKMRLLDYFKFTNSDKMLNRGFGSYLNGDFKLGTTRGADALALHWYSRNLRIFRNIQDIVTSPEDRILVIFGRGHVEILKHLFECSPEFNLIKFGELDQR